MIMSILSLTAGLVAILLAFKLVVMLITYAGRIAIIATLVLGGSFFFGEASASAPEQAGNVLAYVGSNFIPFVIEGFINLLEWLV